MFIEVYYITTGASRYKKSIRMQIENNSVNGWTDDKNYRIIQRITLSIPTTPAGYKELHDWLVHNYSAVQYSS